LSTLYFFLRADEFTLQVSLFVLDISLLDFGYLEVAGELFVLDVEVLFM